MEYSFFYPFHLLYLFEGKICLCELYSLLKHDGRRKDDKDNTEVMQKDKFRI